MIHECWTIFLDKLFCRKNLGISQGQFDQMEEDEVEDMLDRELWIKDNFKVWKEEKDAEMRIKMAQSGRFVIHTNVHDFFTNIFIRYRQYRRYMKNHGSDRMTFED